MLMKNSLFLMNIRQAFEKWFFNIGYIVLHKVIKILQQQKLMVQEIIFLQNLDV